MSGLVVSKWCSRVICGISVSNGISFKCCLVSSGFGFSGEFVYFNVRL